MLVNGGGRGFIVEDGIEPYVYEEERSFRMHLSAPSPVEDWDSRRTLMRLRTGLHFSYIKRNRLVGSGMFSALAASSTSENERTVLDPIGPHLLFRLRPSTAVLTSKALADLEHTALYSSSIM
jgi:hypothetical protein